MPNIGDRVTIEFEFMDMDGTRPQAGAVLAPVDRSLLIEGYIGGLFDEGQVVLNHADIDRVEWTPAPKPPLPVEVGTHLIATVENKWGSRFVDVELVRVETPSSNDDVWISLRPATTGNRSWFSDEEIKDWRLK